MNKNAVFIYGMMPTLLLANIGVRQAFDRALCYH